MLKYVAVGMILAFAVQTNAQVGFTLNPQIGTIGVRTSNEPRAGIATNSRLGVVLGMDTRLGNRFFFQPGVFLTTSKTVYNFEDSIGFNEDEIARTSMKLKAMFGGKLVDLDHYNLRIAAGPTYDFLIGLNDQNNDNEVFVKEQFSNGIFNLDAAIGMDIYVISLEFGYSYGLTHVFQEDYGFNPKARYNGLYATIGFVFGLSEPN